MYICSYILIPSLANYYLFQGKYQGKDVAIFQYKPKCFPISPEGINLAHLQAELEALTMASSFTQDLHALAEEKNVLFPGKLSWRNLIDKFTQRILEIIWNVDNAFIGMFKKIPGFPNRQCAGLEIPFGPLPYFHFLCVPYLDFSEQGAIELRAVSGPWPNRWAREASDGVAAFVHFAYRESKENILFSDLQGKG